MFWKYRKKRPGETLIEILISLFVITIGGAAATTLIISALQTNAVTRQNLIALNLAREGLEAVRNIRDTNWLRWGTNTTDCWNIRDNTGCGDPSPPKMTTGPYRVAPDQTGGADHGSFLWTLVDAQVPLDLSVNPASDNNLFYRLDVIDRFTDVDSDNDGDKGNDRDLYTHTTTPGPPAQNKTSKKTPGTIIETSPFFRMIYIEEISAGELKVYSIVQWLQGGKVQEIKLISTLTNYQD